MKGSVYKRGKTWSIDAKIYKDENGKWVRLQKGGFRTKKDADNFLREQLNKLDAGQYSKNDNMTVEEFLNIWLSEYAKHNMKQSTYSNREVMILKRIVPVLGKLKLDDLKPIHFTRFYNQLHDEKLSSQYIHSMHSLLRSAFKHAFKWQLSSTYLMQNVDAPKITVKKQLQTWTLEQSVQFLDYTASLENEYCHIAYVLAIFTGMRRGEVLGLRWSDINIDKKTLQVVQTVYRTNGQAPSIQTPKTANSSRSITIPDNVIDELKTHKAKQNQLRLLFGQVYQDNGLVCPNPNGTPMDPRLLHAHFVKCAERAGLTTIRFHDLRHTHATIMLQLGEHPKVVSERLGHSNINITLNTYSHVLPNMQEDAARKLFEAFKKAKM